MEKIIYLILFVLSTQLSFAEDTEIIPQETQDLREIKQKILYDFKKYQSNTDVDFVEAINDLSSKTENYVKFRTLECKGEFSIVEINEDGESVVAKKKLSKTEVKLCMLDLLNFKKRYVETVYDLRKRLLRIKHKEQLSNLEKDLHANIEQIEVLSSQYK